ncbi:MAG: substrate-binding domain-containing protein [Defluviitaleaceae bacterium]|nr:substrate-binding domain-containing protein [Defluviitaleaceae bacterium]MCL2264185.1 substrate-binding domain-containing protein [Defluviitaleaceae bacterium]
MKKILALALFCLAITSLAACGANTDTNENAEVGYCLAIEMPIPDCLCCGPVAMRNLRMSCNCEYCAAWLIANETETPSPIENDPPRSPYYRQWYCMVYNEPVHGCECCGGWTAAQAFRWQCGCYYCIIWREEQIAEQPSEEQPPEYITYESGILGVKFTIPNLPVWNFWGWNYAGRDLPLLTHTDSFFIEGQQEALLLEIGMGSEHPRNRDIFGFRNEEPLNRARWNWVHPNEPCEVFTTPNGLTVVRYSDTARMFEWDENSTYYTTFLFMFREDGRDYREVTERSTFFHVMLHAPVDMIENFYADALAVVNGFQFHEGAEVTHGTTRMADALGITTTNFPLIDGSTSTIPLLREIITAMYTATTEFCNPWKYNQLWRLSRTVPSYELLLAGEADLILVPQPSAFVLNLAAEAGVELEFIPVAAEALVFITAQENPVTEITTEQILQIYAYRTITNWAEIGGTSGRILPFNRNPHSGSQTLMDNLVLEEREMHPSLDHYDYVIGGMGEMISITAEAHTWSSLHEPTDFALGYTVYFFLHQWAFDADIINTLAVDGVAPSRETIISGEYPFSTNYYAVLRADTPQNHPARIIAEWLITPEGQNTVEAAGLGRIE